MQSISGIIFKGILSGQFGKNMTEVINMIDNSDLPIGFTMELAQHSDILNRFAGLSEPERNAIIEGARDINSRQEMRNYVESMFYEPKSSFF